MFFVYIIKSLQDGSFYIGQTKDIEDRLQRHNAGKSQYTKSKRPWKLVYFEGYETRKEAVSRELDIKRKKSKRYLETLIKGFNVGG